MNKLGIFVSFILGAASGSAITYKLIKDKYERRYQEEREAMREALMKNTDDKPVEAETDAEEEIDRIIKETKEEKTLNLKKHVEILQENGYTNYTKPGDVDDNDIDTDDTYDYKPYVVSPMSFGQEEGYTVISVMYFADQILVDDDYDIVEDVESFVGFESLNHFGTYEDDPDSVYVRNPKLRLDIEILRSELTYAEAMQTKPYKLEV